MQVKCFSEQNAAKSGISSNKDCGGYLNQAVSDVKKDVLVRQKALDNFIGRPCPSASPGEGEGQTLPGTRQPSLVGYARPRELVAREHELEYVKEDTLRVAIAGPEADQFDAINKSFVKSLAEAKAAVKSVESAMNGGRGRDYEEERGSSDEGTELLESSREGCLEIKEILDPLARSCRAEEGSLCGLRHLDEDGDPDNAALKSALRTLARLVSEVDGWKPRVLTDNMSATARNRIVATDAAEGR